MNKVQTYKNKGKYKVKGGYNMNKNKLKRIRCENLLEHLMRNAVGYENKKSAESIINFFTHPRLPDDDERKNLFKTRQDIEVTILTLSKVSNRKVGSSIDGYWMMCSKDGDNYPKSQSKCQLNLEEQKTKILSDDLYKINEEIFDINMSDRISYEDNRRWEKLIDEKTHIVNLAKEELK